MGNAREQLLDEQLAELRHTAATMTEFVAKLGGQIVNDTLHVWSGTFDATGVQAFHFSVAAGSVRVRNLSATNKVTISSAGPGPATPTGLGTHVVPAGAAETMPLASHLVTLYGTTGDQVNVAVYTAAVRPVT